MIMVATAPMIAPQTAGLSQGACITHLLVLGRMQQANSHLNPNTFGRTIAAEFGSPCFVTRAFCAVKLPASQLIECGRRAQKRREGGQPGQPVFVYFEFHSARNGRRLSSCASSAA
jgi:hypothetical protein